MNLVVDDSGVGVSTSTIVRRVEDIQECLEAYGRVMLQFSELGINSANSMQVVLGLVARANSGALGAGEAVEGLSDLARTYIDDLERIDGELY